MDREEILGSLADHVQVEDGYRVSLEAAQLESGAAIDNDSVEWKTLLPEQKLDMDRQHEFSDQLQSVGTVSHVRMSIYPDGGVSRLRLYGRPAGR